MSTTTTATTSSTPKSFKEKLEKSRRRYQGSRASRTKHVFGYDQRERKDKLYEKVTLEYETGVIEEGEADKIDNAINTAKTPQELDVIERQLNGIDVDVFIDWIKTLPIPPGYTEPVQPDSYKDNTAMTDENDLSNIGDVFDNANVNKTSKAQNAPALGPQGGAKKMIRTTRKLVMETPDKPKVTVTRKRRIETTDDDDIDESNLSPEEIEIVRAGKAVKIENPDLYKEQTNKLCERCHWKKQKARSLHPTLKLCSSCDRLWYEKEMRKEAAALREEQNKKDLMDIAAVKKYEMLRAKLNIRTKAAKLRKLNEDAE